ncbi:unnamed protein product [Prorocentrum cordatum]|uniref:Calmodulin n=1 Tax=Prorocentrum cordatum TaxID=2364126 RepID=A0ABN9XZ36_9DINO|nr:unnamed protein product [Polarella glacialis]
MAFLDAGDLFAYYDRAGTGVLGSAEFTAALRAGGACPSRRDVEDAHSSGRPLDAANFRLTLRALQQRRTSPALLAERLAALADEIPLDAAGLEHVATSVGGEPLEGAELDLLLQLAPVGADPCGAVDFVNDIDLVKWNNHVQVMPRGC